MSCCKENNLKVSNFLALQMTFYRSNYRGKNSDFRTLKFKQRFAELSHQLCFLLLAKKVTNSRIRLCKTVGS